jgi:hypothetical protein
VRQLEQNSRAITSVYFAAACSAMLQVEEHLNGFSDDVVRFPSVNVDDKAGSTTLVLALWIVETLLFR